MAKEGKRRGFGTGLLALALAMAPDQASSAEHGRPADPALSANEGNALRLVAVETSGGELSAWFQPVGASTLVRGRVGDALADGELRAIDPDTASVTLHVVKEDPNRRLLRPSIEFRVPASGDLPPGLLAAEGGDCPRFFDRLEGESAVFRAADGVSEIRVGSSDELCEGWRIDRTWPRPELPGEGFATLEREGRRLVLRSAWP